MVRSSCSLVGTARMMSMILPRVLSADVGSAWAGPNLLVLTTSEPLTEKFSGRSSFLSWKTLIARRMDRAVRRWVVSR
eukprot:9354195-Alexandrium_andersonii.AAC.1